MQLMSQGHDRMTICAEHETKAPGRMRSLSRQRDRDTVRSGWQVTGNLGTILCISNPIHQQDWTCSSVKVILEGKGHCEAGFTMHATQSAGKHIQACATGERAGLVNLMYSSKVVGWLQLSVLSFRNTTDTHALGWEPESQWLWPGDELQWCPYQWDDLSLQRECPPWVGHVPSVGGLGDRSSSKSRLGKLNTCEVLLLVYLLHHDQWDLIVVYHHHSYKFA